MEDIFSSTTLIDSARREKLKEQFFRLIIGVLKNRFLTFDKKKVSLAPNSEAHRSIISFLLLTQNEKALSQGLSDIFDEIRQIKSDDDADSDKDRNDNGEGTGNENNGNSASGDEDEMAAAALVLQTNEDDSMTFRAQFLEYFSRLTDNSQDSYEMNCDLKAFLTIIFFEIGVFWDVRLWSSRDVSKIEKYCNLKLVDLTVIDNFGQSLFHFAASLDTSEILNMLLPLDNDVSKYINKLGHSVTDEAIKHGQWSNVQQISLAPMGSSMKNQAKNEQKRIETSRGVVDKFLKQRAVMCKDKEDLLLEELLLTVIELIKQKAPISDSMLLLSWKYETSKNSNENENRLWIVIKATLEDVLQHSKNKRKWIWFQKYIFNSIVTLHFLFSWWW